MSYQRSGPGWLSYQIFPSYAQSDPLAMMMKSQEETIQGVADNISSAVSDAADTVAAATEGLSSDLAGIEDAIEQMSFDITRSQQETTNAVIGVAKLVDKWGALFDTRFTVLLQKQESIQKELVDLNHLLTNILQTVKSPRITQAIELRDLAYERMQKGWLDKARECFLKANELDDTHFLTLLELGKLYLYGDSLEKSSIDLEKATHFLKDALRFWQEPCGVALKAEALLHLTQISFISGNEAFLAHDTQRASEQYEQMFRQAQASMDVFYIPEAAYLQAKAALFLQKPTEELITLFSNVIKYDFTYLFRLRTDKDCAELAPEILATIEKQLMELGYSKTPYRWLSRSTTLNLTLQTMEYIRKQNFYAAFLCFKQAALKEPLKVFKFFDKEKYKEFWQEMIASIQIIDPKDLLDYLVSSKGGMYL